MKKHKFLEEFYSKVTFPHQFDINKHTKKQIKKIKRKYGVDLRDCWNLDFAFYIWLYEHIKAYEKFTAADIDDMRRMFEFKNKQYTQRQLMHKILKRLKLYFNNINNLDDSDELQRKVDEIIPMWQILMPAMWW